MADLEKHAGQRLQDVGLVHDGDLLASVLERVVEREFDDLARSLAGVDPGRNRDRVRIVSDRDVVFEGDVKAAEVFSHQHDVDIVESSPGDHAPNRTHIGVKAELLAQANIDRAESAADRRRQRALQGKPRAPDAVQRRLRQRITAFLDGRQAALADVPLERGAKRFENIDGRFHDLRTDAVARNERCGKLRFGLSRHFHTLVNES